jgi:hypothetical protein
MSNYLPAGQVQGRYILNEIEATTNILVAMISNGLISKSAPADGCKTDNDMIVKNEFIVSEIIKAWEVIYQTVKNT